MKSLANDPLIEAGISCDRELPLCISFIPGLRRTNCELGIDRQQRKWQGFPHAARCPGGQAWIVKGVDARC
jgi:hypothetical protein